MKIQIQRYWVNGKNRYFFTGSYLMDGEKYSLSFGYSTWLDVLDIVSRIHGEPFTVIRRDEKRLGPVSAAQRP